MKLVGWSCAAVGMSMLLGCARKAPGPTECHGFALRVAGVPSASREQELALTPLVRKAIEEVTVRCLTTPYDRELLACVEGGRDVRGCFAAFRARHPERVRSSAP